MDQRTPLQLFLVEEKLNYINRNYIFFLRLASPQLTFVIWETEWVNIFLGEDAEANTLLQKILFMLNKSPGQIITIIISNLLLQLKNST